MDQNLFVFYEGTTAVGITLNDEKFGMLCGNHIYMVMCIVDINTIVYILPIWWCINSGYIQ
jgi:hypothetical protein